MVKLLPTYAIVSLNLMKMKVKFTAAQNLSVPINLSIECRKFKRTRNSSHDLLNVEYNYKSKAIYNLRRLYIQIRDPEM